MADDDVAADCAVSTRSDWRVGVAGYGTIGRRVVRAIDTGIAKMRLSAIGLRDVADGERLAGEGQLAPGVRMVASGDLWRACDLIVDCAPSGCFDAIVLPALDRGRTVISVNVTAALRHPDLAERAARSNGTLIFPTGAIVGLDAVRAAAEDGIRSVTLITRKPARSLANAAPFQRLGIAPDMLDAPVRLFAGDVTEAARHFPDNVNVAAALALAGIGAQRTAIEVWADPALERNTHRVEVEADSARFAMQIENIPSDTNPATGRISALSVIAALRRLSAPIQIGS